jgi:hypothetical protein
MQQWLIRTADNWISGPYTLDQVSQMILGGKLGPEDEVCTANGYWFYLHESTELKTQLGIELPPSCKKERGSPISELEKTDVDLEMHEAAFLEPPDSTAIIDRGSIEKLRSQKKEKETLEKATQNAPNSKVILENVQHSEKKTTSKKTLVPRPPLSKVEVKGVKSQSSFWKKLSRFFR